MQTPVFDFHTHAGRWGNSAVYDDIDTFVRIMDAAGVDRCNINCIFHSDVAHGNEVAASFPERYPDRFVGVAVISPLYPEEVVPQLERGFGELGLRSLKVYPNYYQKPIDDPGYFPAFEWCNDRGVTIMSHSSAGAGDSDLTEPQRFVPLAERYPNINWVLAHSGNTRVGQAQAVEAALACPNIYLETCTSFGDHTTITDLVNGAGEDRVLFGSDMPLMDARNQVGRIVNADISTEAKRKVLGLNAIKLLGLD